MTSYITSDVVDFIKKQTIAVFNQFTKGHEDDNKLLRQQYAEIVKKIERLEERFVNEEIKGDLYSKFSEKFRLEKSEIEKNLLKSSEKVSNLEECVDLAVDFAMKMPLGWLSADYYTQQRIQYLLFPEGMRYDKETGKCRTFRINKLFVYVAYF